MRKRNLILITLVFALIVCATIQPTIAYFTTYVRAKGGHEVSFGDTTKITEEYSGFTKKVTIWNEEDSYPVFIRAKVLYEGKFNIKVSGDGWTDRIPDDPIQGYYYYGESSSKLTILNENDHTNELKVEILDVPTGKEAVQQLTEGEKSFSVVVVYESTPVRYDTDGKPYANWEADIIEIGSTTGTGGNG